MRKNILIFGGGTKNKIGNMFVLKARAAGHRVVNVSHKDHGFDNPDDIVMDYNSFNDIKATANKLLEKLDHIDIVIFNQNPSAYPFSIEEIHGEPCEISYKNLFMGVMVVPHMMLSKLSSIMNDGSKVVFMVSSMAWNYDIDFPTVGYPGIKSMLTHFMKKLSRFRTKKITYTGLHPILIQDHPNFYEELFLPIYNFILTFEDEYNGRIVEIHEGKNKLINIFSRHE